MSYEPATCLIPNCDGYGHPDECTRYLAKTVVGEQLELSTEIVVNAEGDRHISVFGIRGQYDEALLVRCTTRAQLLALAAEFADVAALIEQAVDELPEDTEGRCHDCEQMVLVEELAPDGNGDLVCGDCRSSDASADDSAAYRAYAMGR